MCACALGLGGSRLTGGHVAGEGAIRGGAEGEGGAGGEGGRHQARELPPLPRQPAVRAEIAPRSRRDRAEIAPDHTARVPSPIRELPRVHEMRHVAGTAISRVTSRRTRAATLRSRARVRGWRRTPTARRGVPRGRSRTTARGMPRLRPRGTRLARAFSPAHLSMIALTRTVVPAAMATRHRVGVRQLRRRLPRRSRRRPPPHRAMPPPWRRLLHQRLRSPPRSSGGTTRVL